ncbi:sensor domain-containing diguanylate cyclase [Kushneria aurantia]|uniref:diguanylate cyclase n=1 Tax=Kushneria aurantia TaxID=504092 RepID=A0ABV6G8C7_9GAMM|nr:sensor domain-containing diguanylate cyclase [Kushneria aurantia]
MATSQPHFSDIDLLKLVRSTPLAICITNAEGRFTMVNNAYCRLYDYDESELLGRDFTMVLAPQYRDVMRTMHQEFINSGSETDALNSRDQLQAEWEVINRHGQPITILADAVRIQDAEGNDYKATFVIDISARKALERRLQEANEQLTRLAMYDELTALLNRRAGLERLSEAMHEYQRYGHALSIAMMDLDHFKRINDTHGHGAGDAVLVAVADTLRRELRESDTGVRLGGEELLLILPGIGVDAARLAVDRIRQALEAEPLGEQRLRVTFSAGVAEYRGESRDHLLESADRALYEAKAQGRNRVLEASRDDTA